MSESAEKALAEALELSPIQRTELIDQLLSSFEFPPKKSIDKTWAKEAEDRIDAYERGELTQLLPNRSLSKLAGKT
ncbi:addiction module protein [candidate division KSB1 bacterium]|nr:addiction module protein [candidate division KSB1 bacterium]NIU90967.1 addiction module protein [candidate division KSB1 bacterium]